MSKISSFEEFLQNKKKEEKPVNWDERLSTWLTSIDNLYKQIRAWLEPFQEKSLIKISEKNILLTEEHLGQYEAKRLVILLGNDTISLIPKGTLIVGSYGRVDMNGPKGDLYVIEPEWNKWKFAKRTPKLELWDFTEESFKSAIQDIING